jgi:hypothetical protein
MAEIRSCRCQQRRRGVWPHGAQVRRTLGRSRKADSPTKTREAPSRAAFFYAGPHRPRPRGDRGLVALEGAAFRLLHGPVERVEQPAYVVGVVPNPEVPLEDLGDPGRGPEVRAVPVGEGSLAEESEEPPPLARGQLRRPARGGPHLEPARPAAAHRIAPAHHGTRRTAQPARDGIQREPLAEECHRLAAPVFQHGRGAFGSHGGCPPEWG